MIIINTYTQWWLSWKQSRHLCYPQFLTHAVITRDIFEAHSQDMGNGTVAISCSIEMPKPVLLHCRIFIFDNVGHERVYTTPIVSAREGRTVISGLKSDHQYMYRAALLGLENVCCVVNGTFTLDHSQGEPTTEH